MLASLLGYPVDRIAKTLLLKSRNPSPSEPVRFFVGTLSVNARIDLVRFASALKFSPLSLASFGELASLLDYPPLGVSPLGVPGLPVFLDRGLLQFETVLVGAGIAGVEVEIAPRHLIDLSAATVTNLR